MGRLTAFDDDNQDSRLDVWRQLAAQFIQENNANWLIHAWLDKGWGMGRPEAPAGYGSAMDPYETLPY